MKPETGLLAMAQAAGMSLESRSLNALSPDEDAKAFLDWSASHRPTPPLSDYAVSRESMYEDRDRE